MSHAVQLTIALLVVAVAAAAAVVMIVRTIRRHRRAGNVPPQCAGCPLAHSCSRQDCPEKRS